VYYSILPFGIWEVINKYLLSMSSRFAAVLLVILLVPGVAAASSVMRTGETVSVAADQAVEGDFYGLGNSVAISGEVTDDLLVASGQVTVNGQVGSDLAALAGSVVVDGVVGDDARIVAGEVTVTGEVLGDLVVVAGTLKVLSTAKVSGDILFFGTEAEISGEVGKSVLGTSETLRIDGVVLGDINVRTNELVLGERTDVTGKITYISAVELVRAQNARVAGQVVRNEPVFTDAGSARDVVVPLLIFIFGALVWYLLFGRLLERVTAQSLAYPLRSMLIGFGLFFLLPIATSILIMSTLGSLIGLTLLFSYFALLFISITLTGVVAGAYIMKLVSKKTTVSIPVVLMGTTVTFLLLFIPVIGPVLLAMLLIMTMGALTTHLYRIIRFS
jgi:cytoskeletal protein CcmA (bactofilin family)